MKVVAKKDWPVANVRRFLEPGPIVLVTSAWRGKTNIMTMGWHAVMGFEPSLVGCYIWEENHSFGMVRASRECVINVPTFDMASQVVGIGNCSGAHVDKFERFALTPLPATKVAAPLIGECHSSFECKVVDAGMVPRYNFFILEVVKAHAAVSPRVPRTIHYRGDGQFMVSGREVSFKRLFKRENL
jgi:flavin reductase (DIM6/NTAB) family NADH-FMN oxidoreductase RutF